MEWLAPLDVVQRARAQTAPLLIVVPRDDPRSDHAALAALAAARPAAALAAIPGGPRAFLEAPWPAVVAEWAVWAAGR